MSTLVIRGDIPLFSQNLILQNLATFQQKTIWLEVFYRFQAILGWMCLWKFEKWRHSICNIVETFPKYWKKYSNFFKQNLNTLDLAGHRFLISHFTHNIQLLNYFDKLLSQNDVGKQDFFSFFFSNVATTALLLTSLLMIWKF